MRNDNAENLLPEDVEQLNNQEIQRVLTVLYEIINHQNNIIKKVHNNYIRLQNNVNMLEQEIHENKKYKKLCYIILNKINNNPVSSLKFLYSMKRKIKKFEQNI